MDPPKMTSCSTLGLLLSNHVCFRIHDDVPIVRTKSQNVLPKVHTPVTYHLFYLPLSTTARTDIQKHVDILLTCVYHGQNRHEEACGYFTYLCLPWLEQTCRNMWIFYLPVSTTAGTDMQKHMDILLTCVYHSWNRHVETCILLTCVYHGQNRHVETCGYFTYLCLPWLEQTCRNMQIFYLPVSTMVRTDMQKHVDILLTCVYHSQNRHVETCRYFTYLCLQWLEQTCRNMWIFHYHSYLCLPQLGQTCRNMCFTYLCLPWLEQTCRNMWIFYLPVSTMVRTDMRKHVDILLTCVYHSYNQHVETCRYFTYLCFPWLEQTCRNMQIFHLPVSTTAGTDMQKHVDILLACVYHSQNRHVETCVLLTCVYHGQNRHVETCGYFTYLCLPW